MAQFNLETKAKPILKWAGGKTGVLPQLLDLFPMNFTRYVEPFIGGGAVYFALETNVPAIINDFNLELYNLYATIRDNPAELMQELNVLSTMYCEEYYYELRKHNPENLVKKAARTVFLNKTGFNGLYRQNSKGGFNVPFGKRIECPALYDCKNLIAVAQRLKAATIYNYDFEKIIEMAGPGDFVYCDPPYEPLSASSSFNAYTGSGFTQADQLRLRDCCVKAAKRGAFVAISNSSAKFILELYQGWNIKQILAKRAINSKGNSRGEVQEVLVLLP